MPIILPELNLTGDQAANFDFAAHLKAAIDTRILTTEARKNTVVKVCLIMRGVSGSGKSTLGQKLKNGVIYDALCLLQHQGRKDAEVNCHWASADHFFETQRGYVFDRNRLGDAHQLCQLRASWALWLPGYTVLLVDNTNVRASDVETYRQIARARVYADPHTVLQVVVVTMGPAEGQTDEEYVDMCAKRNTHGVPHEAVRRMYQSLTSKKPDPTKETP